MYERALILAVMAHKDQTRWDGSPYVTHPIRVAGRMALSMRGNFDHDYIELHKIVAVLHDTVEDTDVSIDQLQSEFGGEIALAVDHLTRRKDESYRDFVERAAQNKIATRVKLADLEDNMSSLSPDHGLWNRYRPAYERLQEALNG